MGWFTWLQKRPKGEPFVERHDIVGIPNEDKLVTNVQPVPTKDYIVTVDVEDFSGNILGQTHVKGQDLYLSFDENMEDPPWDALNKRKKDAQRIAMPLHELMHCALWRREDITHSVDPKDILYYKVTGENLVPTLWDLTVMKEAKATLGTIYVINKIDPNFYPKCYDALKTAVVLWNNYLQCKFFVFKE